MSQGITDFFWIFLDVFTPLFGLPASSGGTCKDENHRISVLASKSHPLSLFAKAVYIPVVNHKITGTAGIIPVLSVLGFLFVHGEFHVFSHILFLKELILY